MNKIKRCKCGSNDINTFWGKDYDDSKISEFCRIACNCCGNNVKSIDEETAIKIWNKNPPPNKPGILGG